MRLGVRLGQRCHSAHWCRGWLSEVLSPVQDVGSHSYCGRFLSTGKDLIRLCVSLPSVASGAPPPSSISLSFSSFPVAPSADTAVGINNTYISIYESNSKDQTKRLLSQFNQTLFKHNIPHRLLSEDDPPFTSTGPSSRPARWWPYGTAPERIAYLSAARNLAMAPIQSSDPAVRVPDWEDFTKVIFLNDVYFSHEGVMRLINTRMTDGDGEGKADYDLACAMDYGWSGESCLLRVSVVFRAALLEPQITTWTLASGSTSNQSPSLCFRATLPRNFVNFPQILIRGTHGPCFQSSCLMPTPDSSTPLPPLTFLQLPIIPIILIIAGCCTPSTR